MNTSWPRVGIQKSPDPSGAAAQAGLGVGDVILEVDREEVASPADLQRLLGAVPSGGSALLRVERAGGETLGFFFVSVKLE